MSYKQEKLSSNDENQLKQIAMSHVSLLKAGQICSNKCSIRSLQLITRPVKHNLSGSWKEQGHYQCYCEIHLDKLFYQPQAPTVVLGRQPAKVKWDSLYRQISPASEKEKRNSSKSSLISPEVLCAKM